MKKEFDLGAMGVREMTRSEMVETEGGIIWFLVAAVAIIAGSSCEGNHKGRLEGGVACDSTGCSAYFEYEIENTSCN